MRAFFIRDPDDLPTCEEAFLKTIKNTVFDDGRVIFRPIDPQKDEPFEVEIRCPIASRLHEQHPELRERHRQWADSFRIPLQ